ncbi:MAG: ABC transporter permease [Candidatus Moranbacteria bacterium]|jgi:putative ABC transport system permease protein|nr:ABC transporter permease [Candidatus Moranbacteria bacterium]
MIISDLFFEVKTAILSNKARSGLTMLGIVIGIGSVIAMVAVGKGAQNSIEKSIQSIGSNLIMVRPGISHRPGSPVNEGRGSAQTLSQEDADAIMQKISGIKNVASENSGNFQIIAEGNNTNANVTGTVQSYAEIKNIEIAAGSFLTDQQNKKLSKVAVIGPNVKDDLFGEDLEVVGKKIRINGVSFSIIGITIPKGGTGFGSSDDAVYVPLETARQYLTGDDYVSMINIQVEEQEMMDTIQGQIENLLLERHGIANANEADFNLMNQADIVETASTVTGTFTTLLGAVAGISLLVGGIGIMNMMLTTVTERTREIGLRKAIGATSHDISKQFLIEAVVLTFIGGLLGVILGWLISFIVKTYAGLETEVTFSAIGLAFGVSALIGIIFGYYPAYRASKLNPIQALRYE